MHSQILSVGFNLYTHTHTGYMYVFNILNSWVYMPAFGADGSHLSNGAAVYTGPVFAKIFSKWELCQ